MRLISGLCLWSIVMLFQSMSAQTRTPAIYVDPYKDSVLKLIDQQNTQRDSIHQASIDSLRTIQEKENKAKADAKKKLRVDMKSIRIPQSLEEFKPIFHFPPVAQYNSGMCWCFCGTSFFETEVYRLYGKKIKLSELHTVYYEYLEKVRRYIQTKGDSYVAEGSQTEALFEIWKTYGIVPAECYTGYLKQDSLHNHEPLLAEIKSYLDYLKANEIWDEDQALDYVRLILNKYLGAPPTEIMYQGKKMTPKVFLSQVLKLNMDDYISIQSTLAVPFYTYAPYDYVDNWRKTSTTYNLPLEQFYQIILESIQKGYSLVIGGDVSEPGYDGFQDAAIVPTFDIPQEYIDQDSRELRIVNETTDDDHGIHLIGYTRVDNQDWFLIKDSGRGSRWGKFKGYYFYRHDYIKLKMLSIIIHKDCVSSYLK